MSKKANPTLIGGFVVGAVLLVLAGVTALGGGGFFKEDVRFVAYFDSSVAGLDVGAPVRYSGVQVGTVVNIRAVWEADAEKIEIPVELSFPRYRVELPAAAPAAQALAMRERDPEQFVQDLIDRGLRAELTLDSIVTGKVYVALNFYPDSLVSLHPYAELPEMPTREGGLAKLAKSIEDLPVEDLVQETMATITKIREVVGDPRIPEALDNLASLLATVEGEVPRLSEAAYGMLEEVRTLADNADAHLATVSGDAHTLFANVDAEVGPLTEGVRQSLDEIREMIDGLQASLGDDYTLVYKTTVLIEELTEAARSVRVLANYLQRHPESLISGKGK